MSLSMKVTAALLRTIPKSLESKETLTASLRKRASPAPVPAVLRRTCDIGDETLGGNRVITVTPKRRSTGGQLIYLHGGAYVRPMIAAHWRIVHQIIARTGVSVTVPYYGLAPEHTADEGFHFLDEVYDRTVRTSTGPVFLAGDSAGAALALAMAMRARDVAKPPAASLLLFSPWVDVTMSNPRIAEVLPSDPLLAPEGLAVAGAAWAGERDVLDPLISPITDSLAGLPPIHIFQGGRDIFLPDAERFAAKAESVGAAVQLHVYPDGFHDFVGAPWTPEAKDVFSRLAAVVAGADA